MRGKFVKYKIYIKSILVPVILGTLVGFITAKSMDYSTLVKPVLAPPGILFPIVWSILYILMGVSYGILKTNKISLESKKIYYLQLGVNLLWSIIFFVFKLRFIAFLWIILLDILVILLFKYFYKDNKIAGYLQIPYVVWVLFATYLNLAIYLLNR